MDSARVAQLGPSPPAQVGRYRLGAKLGAGACGAVYEARDPSLDRTVAVKVLLPQARRRDTEAQTRLLREARALARLGHPNIVEVFDAGIDEPDSGPRRLFIVMERLEGTTLRAFADDRDLSPAEILELAAQAADALAAAHAAGVIHRDFKPSNAMVTLDGEVKVLDFGLARDDTAPLSSQPATGSGAATVAADLTRTGTVMGTPRYMAPEQHRAAPATAATDEYALCVSTWELLTGKPPFSGPTISELAWAKAAGAPARPTTMDVRVYRILARGLSPDAKARYGDLTRVSVLLRRAARPQRLRARTYALGSVVLGTVGLLAWTSRPSTVPASAPVCDQDFAARWPDRWEPLQRTTAIALGTRGDSLGPAVAANLQRFVGDYTRTRDELCADAAASSPTALACIDRATQRFEALLTVPDALSPEDLARRALGLPLPSGCVHERARALYTTTPAEEQELDLLYHRTGTAPGATTDEAKRALQARIARARELSDAYVTVSLLTRLAKLQNTADGPLAAIATMEDAAFVAEAANLPAQAADAMVAATAMYVEANRLAVDFDRAVQRSERLVDAVPDPPPTLTIAGLWAAKASARFQRGEYEATADAITAAEATLGPEPPPGTENVLARLWLTKAILHGYQGDLRAVAKICDEIEAVIPPEADWGPGIMASVHRLRGRLAGARGDLDGELASTRAQRDALQAVLGADHPSVTYQEAQIGELLTLSGRADDGLATLERAYHRLADNDGDMERRLMYVASSAAEAGLAAGRTEFALKYARRFAEHTEAVAGTGIGGASIADAHGLVGAAHWAAGDTDAARAAFERAGANPEEYVQVSVARGWLALLDGDRDEARSAAQMVITHSGPDDLSAPLNTAMAEAYRLLGELARRDANSDEVAKYRELERTCLARGDFFARQRLAEASAAQE
ncbi:MAG: serine/threonine-protein kinase [Myxococcota bacterium]